MEGISQSRIPRPGQQVPVAPKASPDKNSMRVVFDQPTAAVGNENALPALVAQPKVTINPTFQPAFDGYSSDDSPYVPKKQQQQQRRTRTTRMNNKDKRQPASNATAPANLTTSVFDKLGISESGFDSDSSSSAFSPSPVQQRPVSRMARSPSSFASMIGGGGGNTRTDNGSGSPIYDHLHVFHRQSSSPFEQLQTRLARSNSMIAALELEVAKYTQRNADIMVELHAATTKVDNLEAKLRDLESSAAKIELLERQLAALRASNEAAQSERESLVSSYTALQHELINAQEELEKACLNQSQESQKEEAGIEAQNEIKDLQRALAEKEEMLELTNAQLQNYEEQLLDQEKELCQLQAQIASTEEQGNDLSKLMDTRSQDAEVRILVLTQELERAREEKRQFECQYMDAQYEVGELTKQFEKSQRDLKCVESHLVSTQSRLEDSHAAMRASSRQIKTAAAFSDGRISQLEDDLRRATNKLEKADYELEYAQKEQEKAVIDAIEHQQEVVRLKQCIQEIQAHAGGNEHALAARLMDVEEQLETEQESHATAQEEITRLNMELLRIQSEYDASNAAARDAAAAIELERQNVSAANATILQLETEIASLQAEITETKGYSTALTTEIQELKGVNAAQVEALANESARADALILRISELEASSAGPSTPTAALMLNSQQGGDVFDDVLLKTNPTAATKGLFDRRRLMADDIDLEMGGGGPETNSADSTGGTGSKSVQRHRGVVSRAKKFVSKNKSIVIVALGAYVCVMHFVLLFQAFGGTKAAS